jgi:creatinine amidohydrolase/Fe(II)-dependent formamide hydrolase-like protein
MNQALIVLIVWVITGSLASARDQAAAQRNSSAPPPSKIYKLEELTWPQIDALNRERTLFILPIGMIEEHGPHLPVGADTIGVTYEANGASRRVSRALPDWNIVMMPPVNYGHNGANHLGDMPVHPGTYGIRQSTLRSLVADLGGQVAQNGFKWIFVMNGHGAPTHNIAINEACDFVSETFRVTMLHLTGLFRADAAIQSSGARINAKYFSAAELTSFGMDVHAGVGETSGMLAVRPDLVRANYKTLPSRAGRSLDELREIATAPGWQGYLSSPARATAAHGRAVEAWWIDGFTDLILRAVRGENMFVHARVPETVPPAVAPMLEKALANEAAFGAKLEDWLVQRRKR